MTEANPSGMPIGPPVANTAPIDEAYQPDQTPILLPSTPRPVPTISQPDTEMAEPIVCIGPFNLKVKLMAFCPSKPSPAPQPPSATSTPAAQRTATPTRIVNGNADIPPMPAKAASHGAPARRYLNERVTGPLLEGMKRLAAEQYVGAVGLLWTTPY